MTAFDFADGDKPYDCVGMGAAIVDILAPVEEAFLREHGVEKHAMTLIDGARAQAIHNAAPSAQAISGGSAANTVVGVAALGGRACFAGKIKADPVGDIFASDMEKLGVEFTAPRLPEDHHGHTARSIILVTPDAARSMNTDLGVSHLFHSEDLPVDAIKGAKFLYLEGYLWDSETAKRAFLDAVEIGKAAGARLSITLSDTFCVDRHRDHFHELVNGPTDLLFANEAEILALYETTDLDEAIRRAAGAVQVVAITRSEKGCIVAAHGDRWAIPAAPIENLVDTTGAGDLFASGFLFGAARGRTPEVCGQMGCLAASEVIQHMGARPQDGLQALFAERAFL